MDGYHAATLALVKTFCHPKKKNTVSSKVGIFPNFVSPEDLRTLKSVCSEYKLDPVMVPDYSDTLDGGTWKSFQKISEGGTSIEKIGALSTSLAAIEFGNFNQNRETAGRYLAKTFQVPLYQMGLPIGVEKCDKFFGMLNALSGQELPIKYEKMRGRLIDSYSDAHKYVFDKQAVIYGEEDMVEALSFFLLEIGMHPILCVTGAKNDELKEKIVKQGLKYKKHIEVLTSSDFGELEKRIASVQPDILIGSSKGYTLSRKLGIPLVRVGFPIHDRIGAQRIRHISYEGTQELFDRIVNAIIETKQSKSRVGHTYM